MSRFFKSEFPLGGTVITRDITLTAAARGAPRHDQRKVVWGVYDETGSNSTAVLYSSICIRIQAG